MRVVFVGRDRRIWPRLLLSVATFGVSRRVWLYRINKEIDGHDALGLKHGVHAAILWAAAGAVLWAVLVPSLGLGAIGYAVCLLFLIPTGILQLRTAQRTATMTKDSGAPYGPPFWIWAASLVPVLGSMFYIFWEQRHLNRFWAYERAHPEHGIEVDLDIREPAYLVRLEAARKDSYRAASRFEGRGRVKRIRERTAASLASVQQERRAVREAGGSTPMLPFLRPRRPRARILHVVCGGCEHKFQARQDPMTDTPLLCPKCGLLEVLPGMGSDPLAEPERAMVPEVKATCPSCGKSFKAVRHVAGPTTLACPHCGATEALPEAAQTAAMKRRARAS